MFTRKPEASSGSLSSALAQSLGEAPRTPPPVAAAQHAPATTPPAERHEEGVVIVGKGTRMQGKIGDCRKLDVHGILEADVVADMVIIRDGGGIKGTVQTDKAEIHGVFEGSLLVHEHLDVLKSGSITGDISYRTLSIQTGGKLRGNIVDREHEPPIEHIQAPAAPTADIIPMKQVHGSAANGYDTHAVFYPTGPTS